MLLLRALSAVALVATQGAPLSAAQAPAIVAAQAVDLATYLPEGATYDPAVPRPEAVLGTTVGEWHARHDQVSAYCDAVALASPRVRLETYGRTHGQRRLTLAVVTSAENHARLEALREAHVSAVISGAETDAGPEVVWLSYGVHGNEPSATNAALVVLYHLAALDTPEHRAFLADTIVVIDPCLNPDGHDRFAHWANMHRGRQLVAAASHREHREAWPGGRTNHYWFDLNRDWLPLVHPESRGRIAAFRRWMPCVITDYHEMGTEASYFFQPGIPTRVNPITPAQNQELTARIAEFHAAALDRIGSVYYTGESFDDFYYGKGSTYPDIQGAVGILFEQASARGHLQENSYGPLPFVDAIRNQVTTSLSTLAAVAALRTELSDFQRGSFRTAREEARAYPHAGFVFGAPEDPSRTAALGALLHAHGVRVHGLAAPVEAEGVAFTPGAALVVPVDQPQFRLLRAAFERRTSWEDNSFYDVSAWTLPLAYGLPFGGLSELGDSLGSEWTPAARPAPGVAPGPSTGPATGPAAGAAPTSPVAWAIPWEDAAAAPVLVELLASGLQVRVASEALTIRTAQGPVALKRGALLVLPRGGALRAADEAALAAVTRAGVPLFALSSGLTDTGPDVGSSALHPVRLPRPVVLVGKGVAAYEAGEVWYELDVRLGLTAALVERDLLADLELGGFTHLCLVSGATSGWTDATWSKVRTWVQGGGIVVASRGAAAPTALALLRSAPAPAAAAGAAAAGGPSQGAQGPPSAPPSAYGDYERLRAQERIAGAIFEVGLDLTHPLTVGYQRPTVAVFRSSEALLPQAADPFASFGRYSAAPLLAGYCSEGNAARLAGSVALRAERLGQGAVVCFADNMLFRGMWEGTRKLFANALFFSSALQRTGPLEGLEASDMGATDD